MRLVTNVRWSESLLDVGVFAKISPCGKKYFNLSDFLFLTSVKIFSVALFDLLNLKINTWNP